MTCLSYCYLVISKYENVTNISLHRLTFQEFDLEKEDDCAYNYVEVYDGLDHTSLSLGRFCGNQTMQEVATSTQDGIAIKFRTDDHIAGKGFELVYELVEKNI
ncbi:tolloid-like protein 1 [Sitophilus oryzae]|uniref:Tolloid-like protein 1 n=1 Tax=Sitophilus oryzae TaxID=7048 RepID=A0A6J2X5G1_SITOR|nr:tolloid-like protein 1 [Sitophilus oryzae]